MAANSRIQTVKTNYLHDFSIPFEERYQVEIMRVRWVKVGNRTVARHYTKRYIGLNHWGRIRSNMTRYPYVFWTESKTWFMS